MITVKEFREERDKKIYKASKRHSHKAIAVDCGLSPSRVKAICAEQDCVGQRDA